MGSNFTYLLDEDNEVVKKQATLLTSATNTADPDTLPASNAVILPVSLPWRSNTVGTLSLEIDFGTNVTVEFAAAIAHNITDAVTEFRFFGDDFSPPALDIINLLDNHLGPGTSWGVRTGGAVAHRFWGLTIRDQTNPDGYYEIGYIVLGVATELGFNMNADWAESMIINNRQATTQAGSPLVGEQIDDRSDISLTFGNLLKPERDTFKKFLRAFKGARNPAFFVPDPEDNFGFFGRLNAPITVGFAHKNKGVIDGATVNFLEDNPGIKINV